MCNIPIGETLYRYANSNAFPDDQKELPLSIFNDKELSCDWEKYQKHPEKSYHVNTLGFDTIVKIRVCDEILNPRNPKRDGQVVDAWKQKVIHAPIYNDPSVGDNYAHSLIQGKKRGPVQEVIRANSTHRVIKQ